MQHHDEQDQRRGMAVNRQRGEHVRPPASRPPHRHEPAEECHAALTNAPSTRHHQTVARKPDHRHHSLIPPISTLPTLLSHQSTPNATQRQCIPRKSSTPCTATTIRPAPRHHPHHQNISPSANAWSAPGVWNLTSPIRPRPPQSNEPNSP